MLKNNPVLLFLLISRLMGRFGFGRVTWIKRVQAGADNRNYYARTSSKKEYVVRVLSRFDTRRLQNEILIQEAAKKVGIGAGYMLKSADNGYVYEGFGIKVTISERVKGVHPQSPIHENDCMTIGSTLAEFHTKIDPNLPLGNHFLFLSREGVSERLLSIADYKVKSRLMSLLDHTRILEKVKLPEGVLHGDFHGGNILLNGSRCAMLDLQSSGRGSFVLDIGRSIADICNIESKVDISLVRSFISGYEKKRKLTKTEKEVFVQAIIYGAACVALWGYQHQKLQLAASFMDIAASARNISTTDLFN